MQVNEYQKAAMATLNPALDKKDVLINSVMGLCGESGEAIDIVKKWLMQGHEPDKERLVRELGDVAWYLAEAATALDVPLKAVFQGNLDKLRQRLPNGFLLSFFFVALQISAAQAMQTAAATSAMPSVSHSQESSCRIFMRSSSPVR